MPAVPTTEPAALTAGETVAWTRALPEYPATLWTYKAVLQAAGRVLISIESTADGTTHTVAVAATVTATWAAGDYILTPYLEEIGSSPVNRIILKGDVRATSILPSPLAALGSTHNTRMLALIELALEQRIPSGLESSDIDGQQLSLIPLSDLTRLQRLYQSKVSSEQTAARIAAGLPNRRTVYTRFRPVR